MDVVMATSAVTLVTVAWAALGAGDGRARRVMRVVGFVALLAACAWSFGAWSALDKRLDTMEAKPCGWYGGNQ